MAFQADQLFSHSSASPLPNEDFSGFDMSSELISDYYFTPYTSEPIHLYDDQQGDSPSMEPLSNDSSHFAQYYYDNDNPRGGSIDSLSNRDITISAGIVIPLIPTGLSEPGSPSPRIDFRDERSNRSAPFQQLATEYTHNQSTPSFCTLIMEGNQEKTASIPKPIPPATEENNKNPEKKKKKKVKQSGRRRLNFSGKEERILIMKWISKFIGGSTYLESAEALFEKYYNQPLMIGTRVNVFVEELKMNVTITIGRTADLLYYSFNSMKSKPKLYNMSFF